jgi:hypothetical protein
MSRKEKSFYSFPRWILEGPAAVDSHVVTVRKRHVHSSATTEDREERNWERETKNLGPNHLFWILGLDSIEIIFILRHFVLWTQDYPVFVPSNQNNSNPPEVEVILYLFCFSLIVVNKCYINPLKNIYSKNKWLHFNSFIEVIIDVKIFHILNVYNLMSLHIMHISVQHHQN